MTTSPPEFRPSCVLIVDDEPDVRESLRDVVDFVGCTAILAASGEAALEVLKETVPCLVIVDLLMPGMTGLELIESIRRRPELSATPILISTSAPERAPRSIPVLPKPVNIDALCRWITDTCRCAH